jgi:uncharacterized membrane protein YqjE
MSSTSGSGFGQGSSAAGPGPGGYDPGAPQGIPPGVTEGGYTEGTYAGGYTEATYESAPSGSSYDTYAPDSSGASAAPSGRPDVEEESVGSLVGRLTGDLSKLIRQELDLAKAELREEGKKAGKAAGLLGGAGLAGLLTLIMLSLTLMYILDTKLPLPWAAFIVTLLWAIVGAVLFMMGRKKMAEVNPKPEQTVQSLKEDKQWVQAQKN